MSNTSNLIGKEFIYIPTGIIYIIYSVREYPNGNHKIYLENVENSDEQITESFETFSNNDIWEENRKNSKY